MSRNPFRCAALLVFWLVAMSAGAAVVPPTGVGEDLSSSLAPIVAKHEVPGLVALVLRGDRVVASGAAGVRRRGGTDPVTLADSFLLCSATKAMTATVAATFVDEGRLSWDTTVGDIFDETCLKVDPAWRPATVAQLLDHRAGAPSDRSRLWMLFRGEFFSKDSSEEKRAKLVARVLARPPSRKPGTGFTYASLDYLIVAAMLEQISGSRWDDLVRQRLWEPLGISTGGFGSPGAFGNRDQPIGHLGFLLPGKRVAADVVWSRLTMPSFYGPAGNVHMAISDWAKFIGAHLRGDPDNPHRRVDLLRAETYALLHRPLPGGEHRAGWFVGNRAWAKGGRPEDHGRVLASLGDNGAWHSEAWLAPERDFAVLVLCNRGGVNNKPAGQACSEALGLLIKKFAASE